MKQKTYNTIFALFAVSCDVRRRLVILNSLLDGRLARIKLNRHVGLKRNTTSSIHIIPVLQTLQSSYRFLRLQFCLAGRVCETQVSAGDQPKATLPRVLGLRRSCPTRPMLEHFTTQLPPAEAVRWGEFDLRPTG